jgi:hypothetical protein
MLCLLYIRIYIIFLNILQGWKGEAGDVIQGPPGRPGNTGLPGYYGVFGPIGDRGIWNSLFCNNLNYVHTKIYCRTSSEVSRYLLSNILLSISCIGPDGLNGTDGLKGLKGEIGRIGSRGLDGDIGPQGLPGLIGRDGKPGLPGMEGERGEMGRPGIYTAFFTMALLFIKMYVNCMQVTLGVPANQGLMAYQVLKEWLAI